MDKQEWISKKIAKLINEGRDKNQAVAIAYSMYEKEHQYMQSGGRVQYGEFDNQALARLNNNQAGITFDKETADRLFAHDRTDFSNFKPIKKIQTGVSNESLGEGVYYWYKLPGEAGFDINTDRDFVTAENHRRAASAQNVQEFNPNINKYYASLSKQAVVPKLQGGGYYPQQYQPNPNWYDPNTPYFDINRQNQMAMGQVLPATIDISPEQLNDSYNPNAYSYNDEYNPAEQYNNSISNQENPSNSYMDLLNGAFAPAMSTETAVFNLGQSLAFDPTGKSQQQKTGNTIRGIAAGGKTLLSLLRTGAAGAGYQNRMDEGFDEFNRQKNKRNYQYQSGYTPTFQEGGELTPEQMIMGTYAGQEDGMTNAKVEGGEHLLRNDGTVQEVKGQSHEGDNNGVDVQLAQGERVISDHLKIGGKTARELKKKFEIDVKADDTYATAVDKYKKSIGLQKLDDEHEQKIGDLKKQTKVEDETTADINKNFLAKELQELEQEKQPLQNLLSRFSDVVFNMQEESKPKSAKQEFVGDGKVYAQNGAVNPYRVANTFEPNAFGNQTDYGNGYYGDVLLNNQQKVAQENARLHPELYAQFFGENYTPSSPQKFQEAVQKKYDNTLKEAENLYGKDSDKYKIIAQGINLDRFSTDASGVKTIDNKFGNFTSTRPNYSLELLPVDELVKVNQVGVNTVSQLKNQFPDLYKKYVEAKGVKEDVYLGAIGSAPTTASSNTEPVQDNTVDLSSLSQRFTPNSFLSLPDQSMPPPSPLDMALKTDVRFGRLDANKFGYEPQLTELYRQESAAASQLEGLSPEARAAAMAQLSANSQSQALQTMAAVNAANAQDQARVDQINLGQQDRESVAKANELLDYERRIMGALSNTRKDYNEWLDYNRKVAIGDFNQKNQAANLNQLFENFQISPSGTIEQNGRQFQLVNGQMIDVTQPKGTTTKTETKSGNTKTTVIRK